jgi:5-methyltetrahydropteroyltriglutamate--homocysteine methyltransferase
VKRSTDHILTTHAGSLARPTELLDLMDARLKGEPYDEKAYRERVRSAVAECVRKQVETGIDVVTDGEQSKVSFASYAAERLHGFDRDLRARRPPRLDTPEGRLFPEYYEQYVKRRPQVGGRAGSLVCVGSISYAGQDAVQTDIANLRAALKGLSPEEVFVPAVGAGFFVHPGGGLVDEHYGNEEALLAALFEALREEYLAIVNAGFLLQIDDPSLTRLYHLDPSTSVEERQKGSRMYVEALNYALRGISPERIRYHTCYGIDEGPRVTDLPLEDYVDLMLGINAEGYSFEQANPRHDHEWHVWEEVKLPEGKVLIPGVISHSTNIVEHPRLVAERLVRLARLVGRENVIAGVDCGFSTSASYDLAVHPTVVWAKFEALVEGAQLATKELWA